jgi:hypothetical protein
LFTSVSTPPNAWRPASTIGVRAFFARGVRDDRDRLPAGRANHRDGLVDEILGSRRADDAGALAREQLRQHAADALAGAGDDCNAISK